MSSLEQEVRTLQKQVRRQRRWNIALGALVVVGGLMAATAERSVPDVIRAKKFEVVNDEGVTVVKLQSFAGSGAIANFDKKGRLTFVVLAETTGNGVSFGSASTLNSKGQSLVQLGSSVGGEGMVQTENGKGQLLVRLGASVDGEGTVQTKNGKGQALVRLGVSRDGEGMVVTENGKGQVLVELGVTTEGEGMVTTENGKGQALVRLGSYTGTRGGYVETFATTGASTSEIP